MERPHRFGVLFAVLLDFLITRCGVGINAQELLATENVPASFPEALRTKTVQVKFRPSLFFGLRFWRDPFWAEGPQQVLELN